MLSVVPPNRLHYGKGEERNSCTGNIDTPSRTGSGLQSIETGQVIAGRLARADRAVLRFRFVYSTRDL